MARTVLIRDTEADPQQSFVAGEQLLEARDPATGFLHADLLLDLGGRAMLRVYDGTVDEVVTAYVEVLDPDAGVTGIRILSGPDTPVRLSANEQAVLTLLPDGSFSITSAAGSLGMGADGSVTIDAFVGGLTIAADGTLVAGPNDELTINPDFSVVINAGGTFTIQSDGDLVYAGANVSLGLPTSDPAVAGALWADAGVVKVSPAPVGTLTVVRIPVSYTDFVDVAGVGLALTDYVIPEGSILVINPGIRIITPFDDSSMVGGVIDMVVGTDAEPTNSIADQMSDGTYATSILTLGSLSNSAYVSIGTSGDVGVPFIATADTPVSFVLPIWADDGTTGEAEGILFLILP